MIALSRAFFRSLGLLFLFVIFGLYLDSTYASALMSRPQILANVVMAFVIAFVYWKSTPRAREMMIYAVIIAFFGEYLFAKVFHMYTYRLQNVPHYVPFGHALLYISALRFVRNGVVQHYKAKIEFWLGVGIVLYATLFLIVYEDVFGFLMSFIVLLIFRKKPRERLFCFTMFLIVALIEFVGTSYGSWYWPDTAFDTFSFLKSANPPSGICLFYFLLDKGVLSVYKRRNRTVWKRFQHIRSLQK